MSWNNKQDDLYNQMNSRPQNQRNDNLWDADERYMRKDVYQNAYTYTTGMPIQNGKMEEYKKNNRTVLKVACVCGAIIIVACLFTFLQVRITRNTIEKKNKELNYSEYEHSSNEQIQFDDCTVTVSDVYRFYDDTEVWMPDGMMLVGIYVEAESAGNSYSDGITVPYLGYKVEDDGYSSEAESYVYPVTDQKLMDILGKAGIHQDQFLSNYCIGRYETDAGYYFFFVDEDATDFVFVIDERDTDTGRMEYLNQRHFVQLAFAGTYEEGEAYE